MRRSTIVVTLALALVAMLSLGAAAGPAVKLEADSSLNYTAAGVELEFGVPLLPVTLFGDVMGWSSSSVEPHLQLGAGARVFVWNNIYIEGKYRAIYEQDGTVPAAPGIPGSPSVPNVVSSSVTSAGIGYRLNLLLLNLDLAAHVRLNNHHLLPDYWFGVRVGF